MGDRIQAGTARADITPPSGIAHMNWGAQTHERAEGVDLPLWCTALALSQGETRAAIVDLDLLHMSNDQVGEIRRAVSDLTGVPLPNIRVSFTHTHSGPTLGPTWAEGGVEMVSGYVSGLAGKVAGAVWEAFRRLQPVRVSAGSGSSDINVNRRQRLDDGRIVVGYNPEGFVDRQVQVVKLADKEGNPVAILVNYACHPTIMAHLNRLITPDYPGVVRRVVERTLGGTCLFLQGAAGNIGPIEGYTGDPIVYHRLGMLLGLEASRVALGLDRHLADREFSHVQESGAPLAIYETAERPESDTNLRVACRTVRVPAGEVGDPAGLDAEVGSAQTQLKRAREDGTETGIRKAMTRAKRARAQSTRASLIAGKSHLEIEAQAICLGDIAIVAIPGEPFGEIGWEIKSQSPFGHTLFSGYSNGSIWYIPTAEAFEEGGYESGVSLVAPAAADTIVAEVTAWLGDLSEVSRRGNV